MKNLLFRITLIFLVSSLIGIQAVNAQQGGTPNWVKGPFFTMTISAGYADDEIQCFDIVVEDFNLLYSEDGIVITDGTGHRTHTCTEDPCSFTWCYPKGEVPQNRLIECFAINAGRDVYFQDGCIIIIDPFKP